MCGIAGMVASGDELTALDRQRLGAAASALAPRGPDGTGVEVFRKVGLAHTRLSIIDLEGGAQPLSTIDGRLVGVVNGEIYNHVELRATYRRRGALPPRTGSDCEAVLQAIAMDGVAGLRALNGMFAFAVHDRHGERLVLGRDRLGIKPLYWARAAGRIVFASDLKGMLALLGEVPPVNADAVSQFLEHEFAGGLDTAFHGVQRVPPGTLLVIDLRSPALVVERHRFWSLAEAATPPGPASPQEAGRQFDELMSQVMTEHLRADVPFGLFLSGGVDSGLLAALLHRLHGQPIETFSIGYSSTRVRNELQAAEAVARRFGLRHHALEVTPALLWRRIPHAVWAVDELMRDRAVLPTVVLSEHASSRLKVVFTGEGGDEAFAGYARYRRHPLQRWAANLLAPGSGGFRTRSQWPRRWRQAVFGPRLRAVAGGFRQPQIEAWRHSAPSWTALQRSQHADLVTALPDNLLVKVDRSLMAHGLEGRVPFLDHRVVEFGLSLPDDLKVRGKVGKHFLRHWGLQHLPAEALNGAKRGFHVPVEALMQGPFLETLAQRLPRSPAIVQWCRPDGVKALVARQALRGGHVEALWTLLVFAVWHRIFVEQAGRRPPLDADVLDWLS